MSREPGSFVKLETLEPMTRKGRPVMVGRSVNPPTVLFVSGEGAHLGEWVAFLTADQAVDLAGELMAYAEAVAADEDD